MKVNKLVKKFRVPLIYWINITEKFWDLMEKSNFGRNIITDFYPFKNGPRYTLWEAFKHPISFYEYSCTFDSLRDFFYFKVRPLRDSIEALLVGKKMRRLLAWVINENDSKLITSTGWSAYFRNREKETKYYDVQVLPFGFIKVVEKYYLDKIGKYRNLYNAMVFNLMKEDEDMEDLNFKEVKSTIYCGFIWNFGDLLKFTRAFYLAYAGKRNIWKTTNEGRNFMRELKQSLEEEKNDVDQ